MAYTNPKRLFHALLPVVLAFANSGATVLAGDNSSGHRDTAAKVVSTAGSQFQECPECPELIVIPPGQFMMGSADDEEGRYPIELPLHPVAISRSFALGLYH